MTKLSYRDDNLSSFPRAAWECLLDRVAVSPVCGADKTTFPSDTWERAQGHRVACVASVSRWL